MTEKMKREHFNLYYIFKEDKDNNLLPIEKVEILRKTIFNLRL